MPSSRYRTGDAGFSRTVTTPRPSSTADGATTAGRAARTAHPPVTIREGNGTGRDSAPMTAGRLPVEAALGAGRGRRHEEEIMLLSVRDRVGAASGAAFVTLIFVGNAMNIAGTSQAAHPSGDQVLTDVRHQAASTTAGVGFVLEVFGFAAFLCFLGYLAGVVLSRTAERQAGWAAGTAVVAGIVMVAIKLGSAAPVAALLLDRNIVSPQLAQLVNDINDAGFVLSWLPFAVFIAATASALRQAELVGRPSSVAGLVLGVVGVPLAIAGLLDVAAAIPVA